MPEAKPRETKLMLHAFLGSNLLVSFYFAAMASFKVTYVLVNCLKAHVTSLLLHTLCTCVYKLSYHRYVTKMIEEDVTQRFIVACMHAHMHPL